MAGVEVSAATSWPSASLWVSQPALHASDSPEFRRKESILQDGVVVIAHDPALNPDITRDKNGAWLERRDPAIHALALAELQQYDVGCLKPGTEYAKRYPQQKPVDGTRINPGIDP